MSRLLAFASLLALLLPTPQAAAIHCEGGANCCDVNRQQEIEEAGLFRFLRHPTGDYQIEPFAISGDGSTLAGRVLMGGNYVAFRCTGFCDAEEDYEFLDHCDAFGDAADVGYVASALSHDGSVAAGTADLIGTRRAVRWGRNGRCRDLGNLPNAEVDEDGAGALGVSPGGDSVVGWSFGRHPRVVEGDAYVMPFQWGAGFDDKLPHFLLVGDETELDGTPNALETESMQGGVAYATNGDTIVGLQATALGSQAVRWDRASRSSPWLGAFTHLPAPWGTPSVAIDVSANGVVVGSGIDPDSSRSRAFRWTLKPGSEDGFAEDLGVPPGRESATARAVSADGRVVVGQAFGGPPRPTAVVWDPDGGARDLGQYLRDDVLGCLPQVDHFALGPTDYQDALDVSADGSLVLGRVVHTPRLGRPFRRHFLAQLPLGREIVRLDFGPQTVDLAGGLGEPGGVQASLNAQFGGRAGALLSVRVLDRDEADAAIASNALADTPFDLADGDPVVWDLGLAGDLMAPAQLTLDLGSNGGDRLFVCQHDDEAGWFLPQQAFDPDAGRIHITTDVLAPLALGTTSSNPDCSRRRGTGATYFTLSHPDLVDRLPDAEGFVEADGPTQPGRDHVPGGNPSGAASFSSFPAFLSHGAISSFYDGSQVVSGLQRLPGELSSTSLATRLSQYVSSIDGLRVRGSSVSTGEEAPRFRIRADGRVDVKLAMTSCLRIGQVFCGDTLFELAGLALFRGRGGFLPDSPLADALRRLKKRAPKGWTHIVVVDGGLNAIDVPPVPPSFPAGLQIPILRTVHAFYSADPVAPPDVDESCGFPVCTGRFGFAGEETVKQKQGAEADRAQAWTLLLDDGSWSATDSDGAAYGGPLVAADPTKGKKLLLRPDEQTRDALHRWARKWAKRALGVGAGTQLLEEPTIKLVYKPGPRLVLRVKAKLEDDIVYTFSDAVPLAP